MGESKTNAWADMALNAMLQAQRLAVLREKNARQSRWLFLLGTLVALLACVDLCITLWRL